MKSNITQDEKFAKMSFAKVYPLYLAKIERKGRSKQELDQVIEWLTGYTSQKIKEILKTDMDFETFFQKAKLNPNSALIMGMICGVQVEAIENPITRQVRYLDKLVDELAKGKSMEKILRN